MCGDGRKAILSKGKNRCMDERLHSVCCGGAGNEGLSLVGC